MTLFSRIIYFPVSSVSLFCVSAERVFFRLALFYMIFLQTTEADRWGDFIQSVLNGLACVAGAHRLCFLQAARRRHAKGRGVPPLALFKGRGWLHTDHILENSHPFVSTPPPPFRSVIVAIKLCNLISTFAEGKQSAWVPQRVLARTVVLERSISPPYTQEFMAIQVFVRRQLFWESLQH